MNNAENQMGGVKKAWNILFIQTQISFIEVDVINHHP